MYVCMSVFGFLIGDLLPSVSFPSPVKNFRSFEPHLHRLRLYADLVRGVLHLWTRGVNAILVVEGVFCPGVAAMKKRCPLCTDMERADRALQLRRSAGFSLLFHLALINACTGCVQLGFVASESEK